MDPSITRHFHYYVTIDARSILITQLRLRVGARLASDSISPAEIETWMIMTIILRLHKRSAAKQCVYTLLRRFHCRDLFWPWQLGIKTELDGAFVRESNERARRMPRERILNFLNRSAANPRRSDRAAAAALFPFVASHESARFFLLRAPRIEIIRATSILHRENVGKNLKPHRRRELSESRI